jgi:hypothetical protein
MSTLNKVCKLSINIFSPAGKIVDIDITHHLYTKILVAMVFNSGDRSRIGLRSYVRGRFRQIRRI